MHGESASTASGPFASSLRTFSRRWTLELLELLDGRPHRFSELRAELEGLSDRVLWQRLRDLVEVGMVERQVDPGPPIRSTYSLSDRGAEAYRKMRELRGALGL